MSTLFISYASDEQAVALEVCAQLEAQGVRCWIAPRDVAPGAVWDEAIVDAIQAAGAFLLILTSAANESPYVKNEVNHAFAAKKAIFTFRVEDVQPNKSLGFYLARHHWTDGFGDRAGGVAQVVGAVMALGGRPVQDGGGAASSKGRSRRQPSIAVLPFVNMSSDPEQDYFSDGLSEEITNVLTRLPGLKVIARTSSFAFKGRGDDVRRIAGVLGVDHILEGSVRKAGPRIRVTAQLVAGDDGSHLWSERFDRELTDIFSVQDEIAAAIASALQVTIGRPARPEYAPDIRAHEAMLKGRHFLMKHTPDSLTRARACLEQALALDKDYVETHVVLALCSWFATTHGLRPAHEVMPLLRSAAQAVRDLDPTDARARMQSAGDGHGCLRLRLARCRDALPRKSVAAIGRRRSAQFLRGLLAHAAGALPGGGHAFS